MARATEWRRTLVTYADGATSAPTHQVKLCDVAPGETVTRVRFSYWMGQYNSEVAFLGTGIGFALGIQLYAGSLPTDNPATVPNADWMWWEMETLQTDVFDRIDPNRIVNTLTGPLDPAPRDVKAQREARDTPHTLWLQTAAQDTNQGSHYLTVGASVLVILPP